MKIFGAKRPLWMLIAGLIAIVFGLLTVKSGADVLFGPEETRLAAGSYMPRLLWFNLLAGLAYICAGAGLWLQRRGNCNGHYDAYIVGLWRYHSKNNQH